MAEPTPLRLWSRVRQNRCDCCARRITSGRIIGAHEPAGPDTRLIFKLCRRCDVQLPDNLDLLARLLRTLLCRCPREMLASLATSILDNRGCPLPARPYTLGLPRP